MENLTHKRGLWVIVDAMFADTMLSGATGAELTAIDAPALMLPGADASHATSAAWALHELMPRSEFWNVLPPAQNAVNVLARIIEFRRSVEHATPDRLIAGAV